MPEPLIVEAAAPRALNIVGEQIRVMASGAQTGSYEIFHQAGPEGSGPPPHSHPWDEAFYVIKGEVEFGYDDKAIVARAGSLVHLPAGLTHWFRFGAGGAEMVSVTSREGASHMFADFDREISPDAPDVNRLIELGQPYGLQVSLPPG